MEAGVIEIRLLGRFSARRSGEEIPPTAFGGRLARTLVRLLVTHRGEFVSHDVLADALWPGRLPADPVASLQVLVTRARRAVGDRSLLVTGAGGYSFVAGDRCIVDAEVFEAAVATGRERLAAGQAGLALRALREALGRWQGDPLAEDAYEDWAQTYRARLTRAHVQALEDAAAAAMAVRDPVQAVALAQEAVTREPLRESASLLLARALAASGDSAAALRALETLRQRWVDELGLDATVEARDLERRILKEEPLGPVVGRPLMRPAPVAFSELAFVGRDAELDAVLTAVSGQATTPAVVSGGPGTGKSRLLHEVAFRSTVPVLSSRAFLPERDEAWGLARSLLREALSLDVSVAQALPERTAEALADILPDLEELRPVAHGLIDPESRRALALEAGVRIIATVADKGALLLVDDLQWADATSLRLIALAMARTPQLGVVLAHRPEETDADAPPGMFLDDLTIQARAVVHISLGALSADAVSRLVVDEELVAAIASESDGTPLAITEIVRALAARGVVEQDLHGRWATRAGDTAPVARELAQSGQRRSIAIRAARQPRSRRDVLSLLALLGRETPARVLASALAADETTLLDDLDALTRACLARLGDNGWAPAHDLVGETVSAGLERAARGRLHHLLARALVAEDGDSAEIAKHLASAGDRTAAAAAYATATRDRLERFAGDEALRLADAGLNLDPETTVRSALLEARAEGRAVTGDLRGARADLQSVLGMGLSGPERARTQARMAMLTLGQDLGHAAELAEMALTEAVADRAARAEALAVAAFIDVNTGHVDRAEARSTEALALFEQLGDGGGVARMLDARASVTWGRGRISEAADLYDRVARLYMGSGKLLLAGTPRAVRAWTLVVMGRAERGLIDVDEALDLERTLGQTEGEAFCLMVRSEALSALGRAGEARETANEALAVFRRLGARVWEATTLRVLGQAEEAAGNLEAAASVLRQGVEASIGMPFHHAMAAGRLASVLVAMGQLESAEEYANRALAERSPAGGYEAHLVLAEIALLRGEANAEAMAAEALARADAGAYVESPARRRLDRMGWRAGGPPRTARGVGSSGGPSCSPTS
jgi:DNA-binding SARP family transcriptional activator/tetratricopeptide (TPR) repeat protein